jgi:hypothetical protein
VYAFLSWIESSALGHLMRESGPWTYPLVNLTHLLAVAALFGSVLALDLALMGVGRRASSTTASPLPALAAAIAPISKAGFLLAAASGIGLLASNATEYQGNPFFLAKFPFIVAGLANALALGRSRAWRAIERGPLSPHDESQLKRMGGISLVCWLLAVTAGRLIGYW